MYKRINELIIYECTFLYSMSFNHNANSNTVRLLLSAVFRPKFSTLNFFEGQSNLYYLGLLSANLDCPRFLALNSTPPKFRG